MPKQKWLQLYQIVKIEVDKYIHERPRAMRNVLNFKKMMHAAAHQASMQKILQRGHPSIQQQIGVHTSRKYLLTRIRKWYREPFFISTVPLVLPSTMFIREAEEYFQNPEHNTNVMYNTLTVPSSGRQYHFFVVKTTTVHSDLSQYVPYTLYLLVITENETVEVQRL